MKLSAYRKGFLDGYAEGREALRKEWVLGGLGWHTGTPQYPGRYLFGGPDIEPTILRYPLEPGICACCFTHWRDLPRPPPQA